MYRSQNLPGCWILYWHAYTIQHPHNHTFFIEIPWYKLFCSLQQTFCAFLYLLPTPSKIRDHEKSYGNCPSKSG
jgi:hypothetical protein